MNKSAAVNVLRQQGWLARTPEGFREHVLSQSDLIRLVRGQAAYEAGDETGGIYGVASGCVELHIAGSDGASTLTHVGQAGFWLGDVAAIGRHRRLISVVAATDTELLRLPRAVMMRIASADTDAWLYFAELLSANFARSLAVIAMLRREVPAERVGALLLNLAGEPGHQHTRLPTSQSDLAAMANLSRSTVSNALSELTRRSLVRPRYGSIEITDFEALKGYLGLGPQP